MLLPSQVARLTTAVAILTLLSTAPLGSQEPARGAASSDGNGSFLTGSYANDSGERSYRLFVPSAYDGSARMPLLLFLHGCLQDATDASAGSRLNLLAEDEGMFVLYPEQPVGEHPYRCWRWYEPERRDETGMETGLILDLLDAITGEYEIDEERVFVAGMSAGAAMALAIAAAAPDRFAAIGMHSGLPYVSAGNAEQGLEAMAGGGPTATELARALRSDLGQDAPRSPIPLIVFHGAEDQAVRPINARRTIFSWLLAGGWTNRVDPTQADIPPDRVESHSPPAGLSYTRSEWLDEDGAIVAEEWIVDGLGHAWSGGSHDGTFTAPDGPDASSAFMRFFLSRRSPPGGSR